MGKKQIYSNWYYKEDDTHIDEFRLKIMQLCYVKESAIFIWSYFHILNKAKWTEESTNKDTHQPTNRKNMIIWSQNIRIWLTSNVSF